MKEEDYNVILVNTFLKKIFYSPILLRRSLENVATNTFLSLHIKVTGGCEPSSTVKAGCSMLWSGGCNVIYEKGLRDRL